jgi:hypothetical protein
VGRQVSAWEINKVKVNAMVSYRSIKLRFLSVLWDKLNSWALRLEVAALIVDEWYVAELERDASGD